MLTELDNYLQRIDDLLSQVYGIVQGLPAEALNWRPIGGREPVFTNSLAVLAAHIAGAEHFWMGEVVAGLPPTRDRDAEFAVAVDNAGELLRILDLARDETRQLLSVMDPAELDGTREARGRTIPVRWCILHVIDHTALHLGHMQLTYQLWEGGEAKPAPLWHDRLPAQ
jgi:uncharacterized damage-inducible protein DinB